MKMKSLIFRLLLSATPLGLCAILAHAQSYPTKPIHIVVPYGAGGGTDLVYRALAPKLGEILGQQIIIENKPGGASTIGLDAVAKALPDGHTIAVGNIAYGANPSLMKKMPFDAGKDLLPVSLVSTLPLVLVVNPNLPIRDVHQLISYAKANPGKLNYSSAGNGSGNHLAAELFNYMAGLKMQHIPYKGGSPAVLSTMSGDTDILFASIPTAIQHLASQKLIPLAVTSARQTSFLPAIPTISEAALPGFEAVEWNGVFVPASTPVNIVRTLNLAFVKALAHPDIKAKLFSLGADPVGSTPEDFAAFISKEIITWGKVVKEAGITID